MDLNELLQAINGCFHGLDMSHGLYASLFVAGLAGGFTHCTAMCGPFVLSQTKNIEKMSGAVLLPYHIGRITSYTLMAMLLASVLNLAFLFAPIRSYIIAPMLTLAGLVFLVTAIPALSRIFPWTARIQFSVPYQWLHSGFQKLSQKQNIFSRYLLGVLLGFMPCGLIVSALMAASTAPSTLQAGLSMISFGLGTMPALIGVAMGGQYFQSKSPAFMGRVQKIMMVWSAIWLFAIAGFILM